MKRSKSLGMSVLALHFESTTMTQGAAPDTGHWVPKLIRMFGNNNHKG